MTNFSLAGLLFDDLTSYIFACHNCYSRSHFCVFNWYRWAHLPTYRGFQALLCSVRNWDGYCGGYRGLFIFLFLLGLWFLRYGIRARRCCSRVWAGARAARRFFNDLTIGKVCRLRLQWLHWLFGLGYHGLVTSNDAASRRISFRSFTSNGDIRIYRVHSGNFDYSFAFARISVWIWVWDWKMRCALTIIASLLLEPHSLREGIYHGLKSIDIVLSLGLK